MNKYIASMALALLLLLAALPGLAEEYAWDEEGATRIAFDGASIAIEGDGAAADGTTVTITAAGTYMLTGTLDDGQVRIAATKDDDVRLVLNGVSLSCATSAPIYASKTDSLTIILADGTENTVTDAASYTYADGEDEPDAAIFAKDDLAIGGGGSLTVNGHYRNGIGTKDDLVIDGGNITITAANDGLRGRDSVTITGGVITIDAANDGIKSNNDEDTDKGWVRIEGGTLSIASGHDGIQAETDLTVTGGTLDIIAGGGAANAPERAAEQWGGRGGMGAPQQAVTADTPEETESDSMKGLKASASLSIEGGTITIDSADDALHTNGDMALGGGTLVLTTGDDGAHADGGLLISGGDITVLKSYEGLEGATITMTGGNAVINASDDGINAAGGTDGDNRDTFRKGGSDSYWIDISGGSLTIDVTGGDGIDSNGAITFSGGEVTVYGSSLGSESAIDADGTVTFNGGVILAAGAAGQGVSASASSTQTTLIVYYSGTQQPGAIDLLDESGAVLASMSMEKTYQVVQLSLPEMAQGETYTVRTSNGKTTTINVTASVMTVSEDGSATTGGGFGGGRGGFGGGQGHRMQPEDVQPQQPGSAPPNAPESPQN